MRKILSVLLISAFIVPTAPASAQDTTPASDDSRSTIARRWRERLEDVSSGTRLLVTLNDGNRVDGLLGELGNDSFELLVALADPRDGRVSRDLSFVDIVRVTLDNGQPILPRTLPASSVARSFEELPQGVLPGDTVYVQDRSGQTTQGLITEITSSDLTVHGFNRNIGTVTFRPTDVVGMELETTRTTSRAGRNTLIGAGVGLGLGGLVAATCEGPDCDALAAAVIALGLVGSGIGLVTGLLSKHEVVERRLVYEGPRSGWELGVFPILARDAAGVGVRVRF